MNPIIRALAAAAISLALPPAIRQIFPPPAANVAPMAHVAWARNANIYEVNIRRFTKEGTINAFSTHLPRLKKMGVDIL